MAIWNRWGSKRIDTESERAKSDKLRQDVLAKSMQLDAFVASLRMELERTEGNSDERPAAW